MNEEIQTFQLTSRRLTELSKSSLVTEIIFFVEGNFLSLQRQKCSLRQIDLYATKRLLITARIDILFLNFTMIPA